LARASRTSVKFAAAMLLIGGSFGLMGLLSRWTDGGAMVTVWWLALVYLVQTLAELCLSPVGLSVTTQLAPALFAGQMLGLWFLATSVGNALNVYVTQLNPVMGNGPYYTPQGCAAAVVGLCFLLFARKINGLMGDVR
jgi:POT family proton-dependent oligopeptide transporter